jgi:hypothetical protein
MKSLPCRRQPGKRSVRTQAVKPKWAVDQLSPLWLHGRAPVCICICICTVDIHYMHTKPVILLNTGTFMPRMKGFLIFLPSFLVIFLRF